MKRIWSRLLIAGCCVLAIAQEAPKDAAEALDDLKGKWEDLHSFRANYTATMPAPANKDQKLVAQAAGQLEVLREKGTMKYRLDQKVSLVNQDGKSLMTSRTITLYDGEHTYVTTDTAGSKSVMVLSPENEASRIPMDAKSLLNNLKQLGDVTLLPNKTINGIETYVFEGAPLLPNGSPETAEAAKMRAYVDKETGVPIRWELLDTTGKTIAQGGYSDIEVNVKPDPNAFVFQVPVGATVIDMTKQNLGTPNPKQ